MHLLLPGYPDKYEGGYHYLQFQEYCELNHAHEAKKKLCAKDIQISLSRSQLQTPLYMIFFFFSFDILIIYWDLFLIFFESFEIMVVISSLFIYFLNDMVYSSFYSFY